MELIIFVVNEEAPCGIELVKESGGEIAKFEWVDEAMVFMDGHKLKDNPYRIIDLEKAILVNEVKR